MGEGLSAFKDIAGGFQGLATVGLAVYGIHSWRRDFLGKRQIELAEEVLTLFYRAQDAIRAIRNPGSFATEHEGRQRPEGEEEYQSHVRDVAYVIHQRIQQQEEIFAKLHSLRYQAMARFGKEMGEPFERIRRVIIEISVAASGYARVGSQRALTERRQDLLDRYENVFWEGPPDEDTVQAKVDTAVTEIEIMIRPLINLASKPVSMNNDNSGKQIKPTHVAIAALGVAFCLIGAQITDYKSLPSIGTSMGMMTVGIALIFFIIGPRIFTKFREFADLLWVVTGAVGAIAAFLLIFADGSKALVETQWSSIEYDVKKDRESLLLSINRTCGTAVYDVMHPCNAIRFSISSDLSNKRMVTAGAHIFLSNYMPDYEKMDERVVRIAERMEAIGYGKDFRIIEFVDGFKRGDEFFNWRFAVVFVAALRLSKAIIDLLSRKT